MKYNAFISYRHTELDMEIAKKLHKGLNVYRSHYMDCNALLAEAGDQLHGKTLTEKEKREYNIE